MHDSTLKKAGILLLLLNFVAASFPPQALAGIIGTPDAIAVQQNDKALAPVRQLLAREDVRGQLVQMGIDPAVAEQRVNALTPAEIAQLQSRLDSLPAGGDSVLVVIGIVFIVLLILEFVGAINIFTKV